MAQAKRDDNQVTTLLAVSNADGVTPVVLWANPTTHRLLVSATSGALDDLSDVVITSGAQGDILYHNGTNWVNLAAGTSGKFLKTQGAAANPIWDTPTAGAAGADTQIQFNDGGTNLGGDAGLTYNKTTDALSVNGGVLPITTDTGALGSTTKMWADLFLASGAVINFDNGNLTLTHSAGVLTLGGTATLALGANSLTMTGSIAATGARVTKGWFTDVESTNMITIGGTSLLGLTNTWTVLQTISVGGVGLRVVNTTDGASVQVAKFEGDRATMADGDEAYVSLLLSNDGGTQTEFGRITWVAVDVNAGTSEDGRIDFAVTTAGTLADELSLTGANLYPSTNDGLALGISGTAFSDLFLASGAVIDFNGGDVTLTHGANVLTLGGGDLALGANNLTMTGSIAATGARVTKGWFTDLESTNMPTVGGTAILTSLTAPQFTTIELGHASDTTFSRVSAGVAAIEGNQIVVANRAATRTIVLTAAGGWPSTTAGCAANTKVETTTNDMNYYTLDFDASTDENAEWSVVMPDSYDGGTITAVFFWTAASGSGDVIWAIKARAFANDDALDQAFGTAVTVTDTLITALDLHVTAATSACTIGGSPAGGQFVSFKVYRDADAGGDTLAVDAKLMAVKIEYGINNYTD